MELLSIQTTLQGSVAEYKLSVEEEVDRMTYGMFRNNTIKGFIPFEYTQFDKEKRIKYDLEARIPFTQYMTGAMTRKKILDVCNQVVNAFLLAEDYMIDASFIILDDNYMYVDSSTGEVGIICLPVTDFVADITLRDFIRKIANVGKLNSLDGTEYIDRLLSYVNGTEFSIEGMRKFLDKLMNENVKRVPIGGLSSNPLETNNPTAVTVENVGKVQEQPIQPEQPQVEIPVPDKKKKEKRGLFARKKSKEKASKQPKTPATPPTKVPSPPTQVGGMKIPGVAVSEPAMDKAPLPTNQEVPMAFPGVQMNGNPTIPDTRITDIANEISKGSANEVPEWSIPVTNTSKVAVSDNTIMLDLGTIEKKASLTRVRTGECITINSDLFVIGKDPNNVSYCIKDNTTISRVHAKIVKKGELYFLQDSNSMNGTYIDEIQVVAGQERVLKNGCRIKLSDEEFEFTEV